MVQCPKCQRELTLSGEADCEGRTLAVYQCDECTTPWEFDGQTFSTALTFAVDQDGRLVDPESLDPLDFGADPSAN